MQTQHNSTAPVELLRCPQVAQILDQKLSTIYAWCRSGKLPHIRLSRRNYRIRQSDLDQFLNSRAR